MKNKKIYSLTKKEFHLICDFKNGLLVDYTGSYWRYNLMSDLIDGINTLNRKWNVKKKKMTKKLETLTDIELLSLMAEVDNFWGIDEEGYVYYGGITPQKKIIEIQRIVEVDFLEDGKKCGN